MKTWGLLLLMPLAVAAQNGDDIKIKGKVKAGSGLERIVFHYRNGDQRISDTVSIKEGEFKFKGDITEPGSASIEFVANRVIAQMGKTAVRNYRMPVYFEPGSFDLQIADSIPQSRLIGSRLNDEYQQIEAGLRPFKAQIEQLNTAYQQAASRSDKAEIEMLGQVYDSLEQRMKSEVFLPFAEKHPSSPVALFAVSQLAGFDIDANEVGPVWDKLAPSARASKAGKAFGEQLEIARKTAVGRMAMDFTKPDTSGNAFALSSLRGKYVLVDFWASWCGPCRRENPNVVAVYNTYKDKNFTVLGVSLDRPNARDKWIKAIHDDNLTWYHVSDLKFWENEVAKQYGIRAIPQNLLIDPSGKIIAKNLRGEELVKKMAALIP